MKLKSEITYSFETLTEIVGLEYTLFLPIGLVKRHSELKELGLIPRPSKDELHYYVASFKGEDDLRKYLQVAIFYYSRESLIDKLGFSPFIPKKEVNYWSRRITEFDNFLNSISSKEEREEKLLAILCYIYLQRIPHAIRKLPIVRTELHRRASLIRGLSLTEFNKKLDFIEKLYKIAERYLTESGNFKEGFLND